MKTLLAGARVAGAAIACLLAAGCGPSAPAPPTPDVQATVSAQVQATMAAVSSTPQSANTGEAPQPTAANTLATVAPTASATPAKATTRPFTNENWNLALSDASRYKGSAVLLTGKVFQNPEVTSDNVAFQMFTKPEQSDGNTVVDAPAGTRVKRGDFVRVQGTVFDTLQGTNAFGASVQAPAVVAITVEVISREDAVAPALKTYAAGVPITQNGLTITLDRIELAASETRVYLKVSNQSPDNASVYAHTVKLVQGSRQLEPKYSFDSDYPELPSTLLPGVQAETVLVFDAISETEDLRVVWDDAHTSNYRLSFRPYQWSVATDGQVRTKETPSPPGPASSSQTGAAVPMGSPQSTVSQFYTLLNSKNLQAAWKLQSARRQSELTYSDWAAAYGTTRSVEATASTLNQTPTSATVAVTIASVDAQAWGTVTKHFQGTWDLVIVDGVWKLDSAKIRQLD